MSNPNVTDELLELLQRIYEIFEMEGISPEFPTTTDLIEEHISILQELKERRPINGKENLVAVKN